MWIQMGFAHYILRITIFLTLGAANPYRSTTRSSKLLLNTQWPDSTGHYRGMCIACWIPKATNTHSQYVILNGFPLQQWLHERPSMLRHTHIAACPVPLARTQLRFTSVFDSFPLRPYAFLPPMLVEILFRCLVSKLDLCQLMSVIRLECR